MVSFILALTALVSLPVPAAVKALRVQKTYIHSAETKKATLLFGTEAQEVFKLKKNGNETRLVTNATSHQFSSPSPSGRYFFKRGVSAFAVYNSNSGRELPLTHPQEIYDGPIWSPDEKRYAFAGYDSKKIIQLYVFDFHKYAKDFASGVAKPVDSYSTQVTQLKTNKSINFSWSPSGERIVFSVSPFGKTGTTETFYFDLKTGAPVLILSGSISQFQWVSEDRVIGIAYGKLSPAWELIVFNVDGTDVKTISTRVLPAANAWQVSPDGKWLLQPLNGTPWLAASLYELTRLSDLSIIEIDGKLEGAKFSQDSTKIYFSQISDDVTKPLRPFGVVELSQIEKEQSGGKVALDTLSVSELGAPRIIYAAPENSADMVGTIEGSVPVVTLDATGWNIRTKFKNLTADKHFEFNFNGSERVGCKLTDSSGKVVATAPQFSEPVIIDWILPADATSHEFCSLGSVPLKSGNEYSFSIGYIGYPHTDQTVKIKIP